MRNWEVEDHCEGALWSVKWMDYNMSKVREWIAFIKNDLI
jgi:hypothetical protein